ncbi:hypothetical protein [Mariniblastus fucicola]|uniref:Uncharacterized protein n=1 Tax=Mariniblastus fucicola TaxID=980251 RepID=A0A5B9PGN2_9BACT|nr:hypothetical protein [Mariniblastus fucicola]QEG23756.1 hypothetical protein MFFC18_36580 [Mariniblastus fucicola]
MSDDQFKGDNPYTTPLPNPGYQPGPMSMGSGGAYLRQMKPLCICMIIQGSLEILLGIGYIAMGFVMPNMIMNQQGGGGPAIPAEQQQMMQMMFGLIYGVGGGVAIVAGIVRIFAGVRGLYLKSYALGITSHFLGMLNVVTCYCIPTSLGLCIWGNIVYFNPEVKHAFKLVADGHDPADVEARMASGNYPG